MNVYPQNNFGEKAKVYDISRKGYPKETYHYIKSLVAKKYPKTLDLGCGTGIATRELFNCGFDVQGMDKDVKDDRCC